MPRCNGRQIAAYLELVDNRPTLDRQDGTCNDIPLLRNGNGDYRLGIQRTLISVEGATCCPGLSRSSSLVGGRSIEGIRSISHTIWFRLRKIMVTCSVGIQANNHSANYLQGRILVKRATGPGKVEELSAPPGRDDLVQGALLFNFDFDDDVVKPEHRLWLDDNAVPLLTPNNGARAFLNATASQAGASDYNRDLSRRREGDVKRFLIGKGVSVDRLTGTFSGEDLSVSQLNDDERDRAVSVWLQVANAGKPRVIPHRPPDANTLQPTPELRAPRLHLGFIPGGGPILASIVEPLSSANIEVRPNEVVSFTVINAVGREIFVGNEGDLTGLKAQMFDPSKSKSSQFGFVKIVQSPQVVHVRGLSPGRSPIMFRKPASIVNEGGGTVTVLLDAKVLFHFVDGPPGIKTSRTPGVEAAFITTMNRIYRGQVGIVFASAGSQTLTEPAAKPEFPVGRPISGLPVSKFGTPPQKAIVNHRKPEHLFNVFLIGNMIDVGGAFEGAAEEFLGLTSGSRGSIGRSLFGPGRCCLLRDPQPGDAPGIDYEEVVAHEAGHALDEDDITDGAKKDHLMFQSASGKTGVKIPRSSARRMMQSAISFPP